ncbi:hypothetical protein [Microcoleus sp. FACHB-68]|uniref:hypothetical protein n=1 Tax=Microcoleus sp. FACHB-68 TaxID=2692826 RepID=UPI00168688CA|nr:hypothetical protein [Microcoleus sp. FACHB-68]
MKYFFLSDGWTIGRVWGAEGLWNEMAWRRQPKIEQMDLCLIEPEERMWLYRVEDAVLMVEVKPLAPEPGEPAAKNIGQVVLKRLISGDQVVERLCAAGATCQLGGAIVEPTGTNEQI